MWIEIYKKIEWLWTKIYILIKAKIKSISFVQSNDLHNNCNNKSVLIDSDLYNTNIAHSYQDIVRIHIHPKDFCEASPLDTSHNKWFMNLSNIDIPLKVPITIGWKRPINKDNKEKTLEFIKHIENNITGQRTLLILLEIILFQFLTNSTTIFLLQFSIKKKISEWLCLTNKFINNHPDIYYKCRIAKGNVIVALDKNTYIENEGDSFWYRDLSKNSKRSDK